MSPQKFFFLNSQLLMKNIIWIIENNKQNNNRDKWPKRAHTKMPQITMDKVTIKSYRSKLIYNMSHKLPHIKTIKRYNPK